MKIKQLSVFLENRPGHLGQVCRTLADAGIDIDTMTLADTAEFGILRLIIRDWEKALAVLQNAGFTVSAIDVMAIQVPDRPGGLSSVLQAAELAGISVEYMYAFSRACGCGAMDTAQIVIRFDDLDRACSTLAGAGVGIVSADDFYQNKKK
ncbi:MAG: ACT domain-containing protein [Kiritimatiellales bacterium]